LSHPPNGLLYPQGAKPRLLLESATAAPCRVQAVLGGVNKPSCADFFSAMQIVSFRARLTRAQNLRYKTFLRAIHLRPEEVGCTRC